VSPLLRFLKEEIDQPYKMLYDLSAIDERMRVHRDGQPAYSTPERLPQPGR
jgi:NADH-quinone oxidoreductase subunit C/D